MIAKFTPEKIKVLVFDVDDTVTRGTLGIKIATFQKLFTDKADMLQEGRELYEFTGKGDRYNIIAHTIGESQKDCQSNPKVILWAERFDAETMDAIRAHGMNIEDIEALATLKVKYPDAIYALSATPQASVVGNIKYFVELYPKLRNVFKKVIGTPMDGGKAGELAKIAEAHCCIPEEVLMVGDGGSDYNGATGAGTQFIGIVPEGKLNKWEGKLFPEVTSITDIPHLLSCE